jgi:hypothetical protein
MSLCSTQLWITKLYWSLAVVLKQDLSFRDPSQPLAIAFLNIPWKLIPWKHVSPSFHLNYQSTDSFSNSTTPFPAAHQQESHSPATLPDLYSPMVLGPYARHFLKYHIYHHHQHHHLFTCHNSYWLLILQNSAYVSPPWRSLPWLPMSSFSFT